MSEFSRQNVLSAAAAGGALAAAGTHTLAQGQGQPWFGPAAPPLAGKELPSFRFALGAVTPKTWEGGWAKQATVAEFPVSEKLAGVLMSLKPGALRELHWHANAAEWAYIIKGQCRITVTDPQGHTEIADFDPGDVTFRAAMAIPSRASAARIVCFCSSSTTASSPSSARSASPTGSGTLRPRCWRRSLA